MANFKEILAAIAAVLVVVLQVINVLLANDIDNVLGAKAKLAEQKAAEIQVLIQRTIELDTQVNERTIQATTAHDAIKDKISELKGALTPKPEGH